MADLGSMTNEQREQHYQKVCKSLGLDPELRLLDFFWMAQGDAPRSLVLYARRGAAEVLRAARGISVTKTTKEDGDGYVIFTVEGTDKTGRTEQAVGVSSTKGLIGERLAYGLMTAHTRATRRLTLQFVGGGLLDESEVNAQITNIATSPASLASLAGSPAVIPPMPFPQVPISVVPGKDITLAQNPEEKGVSLQSIPLADIKTAQFDASTPLNIVESKTSNSVGADAKVDKPKGRIRPKRGIIDISSPAQIEMPFTNVDKEGNITLVSATLAKSEVEKDAVGTGHALYPSLPEEISPLPVALSQATRNFDPVVPTPEPTAPPRPIVLLSPEKQKEYRERLSKYSSDILPKAGMTPSENIGGCPMKLTKFSLLHLGATHAQKLTEEQFEDLFEFLDGYVKQNGAPALVQYIDKEIGVTK